MDPWFQCIETSRTYDECHHKSFIIMAIKSLTKGSVWMVSLILDLIWNIWLSYFLPDGNIDLVHKESKILLDNESPNIIDRCTDHMNNLCSTNPVEQLLVSFPSWL